ncbi:hypothetical protein GALMADRAFT_277908 [Galerina marginata CBS 339.88]|uniref:Uncharacterized protein n=1 Tax=Galerina marginata (strain CBS 339.88) TaxID=685588 RepID=A0A067TI53_GALM3|nr:hypothetical protein GALMADRAFT_277908 [Galerina marginata CBS 339.88]
MRNVLILSPRTRVKQDGIRYIYDRLRLGALNPQGRDPNSNMFNPCALLALYSVLACAVAAPAELDARIAATRIGTAFATSPKAGSPGANSIPQINFIILWEGQNMTGNSASLFSFDASVFGPCVDLSAANAPGTNNALLAGKANSVEISPGFSCLLSKSHDCQSQVSGDTVEFVGGTYPQLNHVPSVFGLVDLSNSINSYTCI